MIILTILMAIVSYQVTQKKWILYRQAENKFEEKNFKEAILLYQASMEAGPTNPNTMSRLADAYVAVGNFPQAIKWYRIYLDQYPKDLAVRLSFARALSWMGDFKEAEQEYEKVLDAQHAMDQAS
jgi:tetratricopeptide (TPR) repeat protein